jgi:hypothetical protein
MGRPDSRILSQAAVRLMGRKEQFQNQGSPMSKWRESLHKSVEISFEKDTKVKRYRQMTINRAMANRFMFTGRL